jgi:hypothetical protein
VLIVLVRLIAHPHGLIVAITLQVRDLPLGQPRLEADAVYRLEIPVLAGADDVADVGEKVLHRLDVPEAIEDPDHEVGIPQPAEAVVPVAPLAVDLRKRGGHRRDERAGLLE